jgi:hypothetical protein
MAIVLGGLEIASGVAGDGVYGWCGPKLQNPAKRIDGGQRSVEGAVGRCPLYLHGVDHVRWQAPHKDAAVPRH